MTNKVITISRQFGSGGRTIGKKVAEKLGIPYYDKELVDQVAKESGFSHEFIEEIGEYASVTSSFLFNIAVSAHPMGLIDTMSVSDKLYVCQTNVIRDLAAKGPCVIVGRCADFILKDRYAAHLHPLRYGAPRRAYCAPVRRDEADPAEAAAGKRQQA